MEMETEKARRISLFLSVEQEAYVRQHLTSSQPSDLKLSDLIIWFLESHGMPKRYVRPKNNRGQGRKKKVQTDLERATDALLASAKSERI
jgi:hypothetical protein